MAKSLTRPPAPNAALSPLPDNQPPQLATLATIAPTGWNWLGEIKHDGYRLLIAIDGPRIRLLTRSGLDWTDRMPSFRAAVAALKLPPAMLDGELVALNDNGVSSFPRLQSALKAGRDDTLVYYAFDLLHWAGWDLRACTLLDRKSLMAASVPWTASIRYSDHHEGQLEELHHNACQMGLEGIIAKRADGPHRAGRVSMAARICVYPARTSIRSF